MLCTIAIIFAKGVYHTVDVYGNHENVLGFVFFFSSLFPFFLGFRDIVLFLYIMFIYIYFFFFHINYSIKTAVKSARRYLPSRIFRGKMFLLLCSVSLTYLGSNTRGTTHKSHDTVRVSCTYHPACVAHTTVWFSKTPSE